MLGTATVNNPEKNASPFTVCRMDPAEILDLAGQFVVQYYTVMHKCPSGLHRFYKENSSMIREDNPVYGQRSIHEKIMELNIHDARVAILQLDALRSHENSVLIQVAGELSTNRGEMRRFMQSFTLCEQSPCDFYVLNDIFRYQDRVYGDIKADEEVAEVIQETAPNTLKYNSEDSGHGAHCDTTTELATSNGLEHVRSWEEMTPSEPLYSKSEVIEDVHVDDTDQNKLMPDSTDQGRQSYSPKLPPNPPAPNAQLNENVQEVSAPPAPRSWAQLAARQPSQPVMNMQMAKTSRAQAPASSVQISEESAPHNALKMGVHRQQPSAVVGGSNPRGRGGRQPNFGDNRSAAGDPGLNEDNRYANQGLSRMNNIRGMSNMSGGRGARGGRMGGMNPGRNSSGPQRRS